jgi:hypothetical protein
LPKDGQPFRLTEAYFGPLSQERNQIRLQKTPPLGVAYSLHPLNPLYNVSHLLLKLERTVLHSLPAAHLFYLVLLLVSPPFKQLLLLSPLLTPLSHDNSLFSPPLLNFPIYLEVSLTTTNQ